MSDVMLFGILRMPFDLAMSDEISRHQYWQRGKQAADEVEKLRAEVGRVADERDEARAEVERLKEKMLDIWATSGNRTHSAALDKAEIERLREALAWYGARVRELSTPHDAVVAYSVAAYSDLIDDSGERARKALEGAP